MSSDHISKHLPIFRSFMQTKSEDLKYKLESADKQTIKFIVECAWNILKGTIPLTGKVLLQAKNQKYLYKQLVSRKKSLKYKKELLQNNPSFVKSIVRIILRIYKNKNA